MSYSKNDWFDSPELIQSLHSKIPTYFQDKWNRKALKIRNKIGKEARLNDFLAMLEEEVNLATDPLYSREAITHSISADSSLKKYDSTKHKMKTLVLATPKLKCPDCELNHDLDECKQYLKRNIEERRRFLFKNRLCFCCYKPTSTEHMAKNCKERRQCRICRAEHPTGLHGYKRIEKSTVKKKEIKDEPERGEIVVKTGYSKMEAEVISLCVVEVTLKHKHSSKEVQTYALLDNGSQGTFIKEDVPRQLGVQSIPATIQIKSINGEVQENCRAVDELYVSDVTNNNVIRLPRTYSQKSLPVDSDDVPTPGKIVKWKYLDCIHPYLPQDDVTHEIGILIGGNCPLALEPVETIASENGGPYAYRSKLGWCIAGPILAKRTTTTKSDHKCNRIAVKKVDDETLSSNFLCVPKEIEDLYITKILQRMYTQDFSESHSGSVSSSISQEDIKFVKLMEQESRFINGHYVLPLPFRKSEVHFKNNKIQALQRAEWLKKKLEKNSEMLQHYVEFMNDILEKGYAKEVGPEERQSESGKCWYIPHFGVYHPKKPDKIRVVFDASAQFKGMSLNNELMQGPDLTNHLIGVLSRFRMENTAIMADIESMFYQVKVPKEHYNYLRFLWWPGGDVNGKLKEFQMCVHLFGAISSPSCANYALRKTALDNKGSFSKEASEILFKNFYVDDILRSVENPTSAINLLSEVVKLCAAGGFKLTKISSNSREVLESVSIAEKAKSLKDLDLNTDPLPVERALGVHWCVENDSFGFRIVLKDKPLTRRGILSSISSVYDPLGFASPFLLFGKQLLQELCADKKGWDEDISPEQRFKWEKWRKQLPDLESISIKRCFKPENFGKIVHISLHHFSDACDKGYGQVSYVQLEDEDGLVSCSFLIGKSRVTPIKPVTVPRLELSAAIVSAKIAAMMRKELEFEAFEEHFWTDSRVVLGYLKNASKKFHVFVANRVTTILENTSDEQWRYVASKDNPADDASRGLSASKVNSSNRWFHGPKFLHNPRESWLSHKEAFTVKDNDPEVKRDNIKVNFASISKKNDDDVFSTLLTRISCWHKLKRVVAIMLIWRKKGSKRIEISDLQKAEVFILRSVQKETFKEEMKALQPGNKSIDSSKRLRRSNNLFKVNPMIDEKGLIRVGGRISSSQILDQELQHPIILPRSHPVTLLIVRWCHEKVEHSGRGSTLNEIRSRGFWVINGNSFVRYVISKCVKCRFLRGKLGEQKMSNLPTDRIDPAPPFTNSAVDMFGPFLIKEGRKELKRYAALFTCLCSRAIHLESTNSMDTDSFIHALRRFVSRRGEVRIIRSDNGTNFVGTDNELRETLKEMDDDKIANFLLSKGTDWISWKYNTPSASHMGGVWERQIRSARSILASLLKTHGKSLNDESFRTLLVEVEGVVNSRPLTTDALNDSDSPLPLTPNHLLTMKSKVIMPPPGVFQTADLYCRRRWRRVQHIVNEFWTRWRKEYLQSLQKRSKWQHAKRNFMVDDIVLLKDEPLHRGDWKLARIVTTIKDKDGDVRSVKLITQHKVLERPISKIVLIVGADEFRIPDEEPLRDEQQKRSLKVHAATIGWFDDIFNFDA